jgi:hypothetical protein
MEETHRLRESFSSVEEYVAWLVDQTVSTLRRAAGNPEALKAAVFLYLSRAYEAGLLADKIADYLAVGATSILSRAALSKQDEEAILDAYDLLDETIESTYASKKQK